MGRKQERAVKNKVGKYEVNEGKGRWRDVEEDMELKRKEGRKEGE